MGRAQRRPGRARNRAKRKMGTGWWADTFRRKARQRATRHAAHKRRLQADGVTR